jgi:hypothetical protein
MLILMTGCIVSRAHCCGGADTDWPPPVAALPSGEWREGTEMELGQRLLSDLFIMFLAARVGGWLLARLRQPVVLGELLAGQEGHIPNLGTLRPPQRPRRPVEPP